MVRYFNFDCKFKTHTVDFVDSSKKDFAEVD